MRRVLGKSMGRLSRIGKGKHERTLYYQLETTNNITAAESAVFNTTGNGKVLHYGTVRELDPIIWNDSIPNLAESDRFKTGYKCILHMWMPWLI